MAKSEIEVRLVAVCEGPEQSLILNLLNFNFVCINFILNISLKYSYNFTLVLLNPRKRAKIYKISRNKDDGEILYVELYEKSNSLSFIISSLAFNIYEKINSQIY